MSPEHALAAQEAAAPADGVAPALIGPHAVIHMVEVIQESFGELACNSVLANAQIEAIPTGECMIPEDEVLRLHRWIALWEPEARLEIVEEAASRTADYIIANRIPGPVVRLLQLSPAAIAAPLLMNAIRRHAWTFVGAGRFLPDGSWGFTIDRTQADDPILPPATLFDWYAAVFEQLYKRLVDWRCLCGMEPCSVADAMVRHYRIERTGP